MTKKKSKKWKDATSAVINWTYTDDLRKKVVYDNSPKLKKKKNNKLVK